LRLKVRIHAGGKTTFSERACHLKDFREDVFFAKQNLQIKNYRENLISL